MEKEQRTGIIDTISAGYSLVFRRLWLIGVPVLLDLFAWFGPRLAVPRPLEALVNLLASQSETNQEILARLRAEVEQSDLLGLLAVQLPSMVRRLRPDQTPLVVPRAVITLDEPWGTLGLALVLLLGGLLLSMAYLTPIAQAVREGRPTWPQVGRRVGVAWLRLVALLGVLLVAGIGLMLPVAIVATVFLLLGVDVTGLLVVLSQIAAIWLLVYLFFMVDAIVVSEVGPLRAIQYSFMVVRTSFWPSLGLILLSLLISFGLPIIFTILATSPVGLPVAILANAFIHTGLAAASMLFYRDRLARWQQQRRAAALKRVGPGAS